MKNVLVLGEVLLRLTPPNNLKIIQTNSFNLYFGGAEANVAVGLSNLGVKTRILTALPGNEIGDAAKAFLKANDVDCNHIVTKGNRLGLYYYEEGCSARRAKVIYDRKNSAITELEYEDIDVDSILKDVEVIHISGITFTLGDKVINTVTKLIDEAKKRDIKISIDLNYRATLFKSYKEFVDTVKPIVKDSYLCFGWLNRDTSSYSVFDAASEEISDEIFIENFKYMTDELGVKNVVTTLRTGTPYNYHTLMGILFDGENLYKSSKYDFSMISRIGGGDAFAAGIIKKMCSDKCADLNEVIEFGVATAVLKQTQIGDVGISSESEVLDLMNNKNLGSVNR